MNRQHPTKEEISIMTDVPPDATPVPANIANHSSTPALFPDLAALRTRWVDRPELSAITRAIQGLSTNGSPDLLFSIIGLPKSGRSAALAYLEAEAKAVKAQALVIDLSAVK